MANLLAGEGVVQLNALPYSPPGPVVRFLPAPLIRARAEVLNPHNCLDLNRTARMALYGVLAFFDIKRPSEPVFASREKLCAEALLGSQPTLYRALAYLVTKGYIRREQGRRLGKDTYGQYSVSRIWLEQKALQLLGLDTKTTAKKMPQSNQTIDSKNEDVSQQNGFYSQGPSINVTDRLQESEHSTSPQLSSKEQPPFKSHDTPDKGRVGGFSERKVDSKTGLPAELTRLMDLGLSKARICALMKQAREHGNGGQLGAITATAWKRLQELEHPQAVFAYISKLAKQKKDYRRLQEIEELSEDKGRMPDALARRLNAKLPIFVERAKGMMLVTRSGRSLGIVQVLSSSSFVSLIDEKGARRTMPLNAKVVQMWEEGEYMLRSPGFSKESCSAN